MTKDQDNAREILEKLTELKRTLPEDQYQEIERQVLPRLAEYYGASKPAKSKKREVLEGFLWVVGLLIFLALSVRFPWIWFIYWGAVGLRALLLFFSWLADQVKPPRMY